MQTVCGLSKSALLLLSGTCNRNLPPYSSLRCSRPVASDTRLALSRGCGDSRVGRRLNISVRLHKNLVISSAFAALRLENAGFGTIISTRRSRVLTGLGARDQEIIPD
jgi:hypothetical protein